MRPKSVVSAEHAIAKLALELWQYTALVTPMIAQAGLVFVLFAALRANKIFGQFATVVDKESRCKGK